MLDSRILSIVDALNAAEAVVALIEDGIDTLQKGVAENVKVKISTRLDAAIGHAVASIHEREVFLLDCEQLVADSELDSRQLICGGGGREDPTLL